MAEKTGTVSYNYEAECEKLKAQMKHIEETHLEERAALSQKIAELERDLMIYEHKWSVIELIFGK